MLCSPAPPAASSRAGPLPGGIATLQNAYSLLCRTFDAGLAECCAAADRLARLGLSTTVADARFAKPLDADLVLRLAHEHEILITVEEGAIGGFGSHVLQLLSRHDAMSRGLKVRSLVLPDVFLDHDTPAAMYARAGLDAEGIVRAAFDCLGARAGLRPAELA